MRPNRGAFLPPPPYSYYTPIFVIVKPFLQNFSESHFGNPIEQYIFNGKKFSRSSLNYLLGLTFLKKHLDDVPETILEIGGGFGTLAEIYSHSGVDKFKYIGVDIPPTSLIAEAYLKSIFLEEVWGYHELKDYSSIDISQLPKCTVLQSWQFPRLKGNIDLFVNFISFQEMEPEVVKNYINLIMRHSPKWILLRNMREGKQLQKESLVGVKVPILTQDYVTYLECDYELIDSNVVPYGYITVDNFHSELLLFRKK
jgi:hypothetical protein